MAQLTNRHDDSHRLVLRPDLAESGRVRAFLRSLAEQLGFSPERTFDIQVAVGEAVANAIEHAHGAGQVQVEGKVLADRLEVSVQGMGQFHLPARLDERVHRGLGLPLMATLSDHLALYSAAEGGTLVTLGFYLPGAHPRATALPPALIEALDETSFLGRVLDSLTDALAVLDREWRYLYVNEPYARYTGLTREELLGRKISEVPASMVDRQGHEAYREAMTTGRPTSFTQHLAELGAWFHYRAFPFEGGLAVLAREITEERRAEEEREQLLRYLQEERQQLSASRERERLLSSWLENSSQPFAAGTPDGHLTLFNEAFRRLVGFTREELSSVVTWTETLTPTAYRAIDRQMLRRLHDTGEPQLYEKEFQRKDGSHVPVEVLVHTGQDAKGGLLYYSFVTDISARKEAEVALRESEERYRGLFDNMTEGFALGEAILDAEGRAHDFRFLEANDAFYSQSGLDHDVLRRPITEVLPQLEKEWIETYTTVALTGRSTRFTRYNADTGRHYDVFCYSPGRGFFAIMFRDVTEQQRARHEQDRLYRNLAEVAALSEALNRVNEAMSSAQDSESIPQLALDEFVTALGCDSGAIDMREEDHWIVRYAYGFQDDIRGHQFSDEDAPFAARALRLKEPVVIQDVESNQLADPHVMRRYDIKSVIVVPLVVRGTVIGALFANHNRAPVPFSAAQVEFARRVGSALSLALENARLYEEQKRIADTLQQALLRPPKRIHDLEVDYLYRSATEAALVGGDFFDVFQLDAERVGLVVGDVCGHGVEAAALGSLVRDTLRAYALQGLPVEDVMTLTNEAVAKQTELVGYTTVFFSVLATATGRLTYSSAGHPPALVRRVSGRVEALPVRHGPPLGPFPGSRYGISQDLLQAGDVLLLYTDGVTEARDGGSLFGEERLAKLLEQHGGQVPGLTAVLLGAVMEYSTGRLGDDLALLAVSRKPA